MADHAPAVAGELMATDLLFQPKRGKPPKHLADFDVEKWPEVAAEFSIQPFRVKQIARHYFTRHTSNPEAMTDIPAEQREHIAQSLVPELLSKVREQTADKGTTRKTLWRLHDGALVESDLMRYPSRATICISSQAGCAIGCPFCATGQNGLERNLSAAEILDQVVAAAALMESGTVPGGPGRLSNVVFMGMGEPMANFPSILTAIKAMVRPAPAGLGLSARNITVSTVGLVPRIDQLAESGIPVTLAISLHAPDDELRNELVPINVRYDVAEVFKAARRYFDATKRRISIEYALIRDVNDQAWRGEMLADLIDEYGPTGWVHVNPIGLNPTPGSKWTASDPRVEAEFVSTLTSRRITTTVRDTRGRDIDGACGQLAAKDREDTQ